jgi:hypothetical protein
MREPVIMAYTGKMRRNYEIRMKACIKSRTEMDWIRIKGKGRMRSKHVRERILEKKGNLQGE